MKKTLKLLMIFIGGLTAIIVVSLTGYFIIAKNKTFYIYDVRFVMPMEDMDGYIYTTKDVSAIDEEDENVNLEDFVQYVPIKNQTVYLKSEKTNIFPIAVYVDASISVSQVNIASSDKDIAKIVYQDGGCYVHFLKEGLVTITSEFHGVKDSFAIQIYDQLPSNFNVYDYDYYGDYAELFPNTIVSYADDEEYRYNYVLDNISNTGTNDNINGDLIRIDQENLKLDVFSNVYIDSVTNELVVKCKNPQDEQKDNFDSAIILQSFYYADDGSIVIENNYEVKVHIVRYIPEFLQLEISSNPDFSEGIVYTDTTKKDISGLTSEDILNDPSILDEYLSAEKAENYLALNGESATYKAYFTDNIEMLYVRARVVYTNGNIIYLKNGENATIKFNGLSSSEDCILDPTQKFYMMNLNSDYFTSDGLTFDISVSVDDFAFSHVFKFEYRERTNANKNVFYVKNEETGIWTFNYWDERAKFDNEIYDKEGNVIAFGA